MSKAVEMAKVSARGGFQLFGGLAISAVISAVGIIIFARVLGPTRLGLYRIALAASNLIAAFRDWCINARFYMFLDF